MGYLFMLGCIGIYMIFLVIASSKADKEYIEVLETERLRQARNDIKIGCIKQSREELKAEAYEEQYKEFYKPYRIKKNKLRKKAINAYKNYNKEIINTLGERISFKDLVTNEYWSMILEHLTDPSLKAIAKYLRSLEKGDKHN